MVCSPDLRGELVGFFYRCFSLALARRTGAFNFLHSDQIHWMSSHRRHRLGCPAVCQMPHNIRMSLERARFDWKQSDDKNSLKKEVYPRRVNAFKTRSCSRHGHNLSSVRWQRGKSRWWDFFSNLLNQPHNCIDKGALLGGNPNAADRQTLRDAPCYLRFCMSFSEKSASTSQ